MFPSFRIAIPSYRRASMLPLYTLRTLQRHGFDKDLIDIFVIQDEYETYKQHLELNPYYKNLIVGVPGLSSQRQFIKDYYPLDKEIFFCDDDLNVFKLLPQGLSLPQIVSYMFLIMKAEGIHLGGFYPTNSLLFMNARIVKGSVYIVGAAYLQINTKETDTLEDEKEDVQRSCYWIKKDGAVLRCESVGISTKYLKNPGGLQMIRTSQSIQEASERVYQTYPDLLNAPAEKKKGKPDSYWDCKFRKSPKTILSLPTFSLESSSSEHQDSPYQG